MTPDDTRSLIMDKLENIWSIPKTQFLMSKTEIYILLQNSAKVSASEHL